MNNEFGYLDIKPFTELDENEQKLVIINEKDTSLEIKVQDVEKFNDFDFFKGNHTLIETKVYYGIDSFYHPLTLYRSSLRSSVYRTIPYSIIESSMFIRGNSTSSPITHFTNKTKVRKMIYCNELIRYLFPNETIEIRKKPRMTKIFLKNKEENRIGYIEFDNSNKLNIKLMNKCVRNGNIYDFNIIQASNFEIKFNKAIDLDKVLKIKNRIDSVIHLLCLTKYKSNKLKLIDTKGQSYNYFDLKNKKSNKQQPNFSIGKDRKENSGYFVKLCKLFININDDDINYFFPFLNYDREVNSNEILFLEYYRSLEYMDLVFQKKNAKGKDRKFMLKFLKKYPKVTKKYFPEYKSIDKIEEEIRSLRNYYSHEGYYLDELPVPTENPNYNKPIDIQWLYNVKMFVKTIAYLEIYSLAGINVTESYLITHLR